MPAGQNPARLHPSDNEDAHVDDVVAHEHVRRAARRKQRPAGLQHLSHLEGGWLSVPQSLVPQLAQAARERCGGGVGLGHLFFDTRCAQLKGFPRPRAHPSPLPIEAFLSGIAVLHQLCGEFAVVLDRRADTAIAKAL